MGKGKQLIATSLRFTSADLEALPQDGKRREIIDGELFASTQPGGQHQFVCSFVWRQLQSWSEATGLGYAIVGLGVIFGEDDDVVPDVVWVSRGRYAESLDEAGRLHAPPELVVEVLSPGPINERRDRETKLKLYSRRGVAEYWIADWRTRSVSVYRRHGKTLALVATLSGSDELTSPLLPGFATSVESFFAGLPPAAS
jgi:Uma2 family endonuclease